MKQVSVNVRKAHSGGSPVTAGLRRAAELSLGSLVLLQLLLTAGCGGGGGGAGLPNVSQRVEVLEEGYHGTAIMNIARYYHRSILLTNGLMLTVGGSDELGLSTIDSSEIYDQAAVEKDIAPPASVTGVWFDTDFEGNPIAFEIGPRIFFTLNRLADGRVIAIGGTPDIADNPLTYSKPEIFDPETRTWEVQEKEMADARFKHTTISLFNGSFLVLGGQTSSSITEIIPNADPGAPGVQVNRNVFPSLRSVEVYSPNENDFAIFTIPNSQQDVELTSRRGRAAHAATKLAGFDGILGGADDVIVLSGGFETLSADRAPLFKAFGDSGFSASEVEFMDPVTRVFNEAANISTETRVENAQILNLGKFNDFTPDGVRGMGNALLSLGGHSDGGCPGQYGLTISNFNCEVFVATFTGFGLAQGLQFFEVEDLDTLSQVQGIEYFPQICPIGDWVGRCQAQAVSMPRAFVTAPDIPDLATWVIFVGGAHIFPIPGGCAVCFDDVIRTGCVFDPYYNLRGASLLGLSPRDLRTERTTENPLGIIGTWLVLDGNLPTQDLTFFGTELSRGAWWRMVAAQRTNPQVLAIPGVDGIINTHDDRLLIHGGGQSVQLMGEPAAPSAELMVPPGSTSLTPTD